jgi:hypothetical protein
VLPLGLGHPFFLLTLRVFLLLFIGESITSARTIGFCAIWVCVSSSSSF